MPEEVRRIAMRVREMREIAGLSVADTAEKIGMEQDEDENMARHARFGDREILRVATAQQYSNMKKEIDSIQIPTMNFPAKGNIEIKHTFSICSMKIYVYAICKNEIKT